MPDWKLIIDNVAAAQTKKHNYYQYYYINFKLIQCFNHHRTNKNETYNPKYMLFRTEIPHFIFQNAYNPK